MEKTTVKLRFPASCILTQDKKAVWIDTKMTVDEMILFVAKTAISDTGAAAIDVSEADP